MIDMNVPLVTELCCFREKKREKERDELWKRLGELEISHKRQAVAGGTKWWASVPTTPSIHDLE